MNMRYIRHYLRILFIVVPMTLAVVSCSQVDAPDGRTAHVPSPQMPDTRPDTFNERQVPITRVALGRDVFVPRRRPQDPLPEDYIGPFELRGETLAGTLQLILDDYDISLGFESSSALTARISVANLRGTVAEVIEKVCSLANLYCHYKDGMMTVKDTEMFVVDIPPEIQTSSSEGGDGGGDSGGDSGGDEESSEGLHNSILAGLEVIVGGNIVLDGNNRVIIYNATHRSQQQAEKYFDRLRKNLAMIVFQIHIWEVTLGNDNRTGIDWSLLGRSGNLGYTITAPGGAPEGLNQPITITPDWTGWSHLRPSAVLEFISEQGTVRTISQPQITVLSGGSAASLNVNQSENFVASVDRSQSEVSDTVSVSTGTVTTGLSMTVEGVWDQSTIYSAVNLTLAELLSLDTFQPDTDITLQLPRTTTRDLSTTVRMRPGDAALLAGIVTQRDEYSSSGPGFMKPIVPTSREAVTRNTELVFLLRPRLIVFETEDEERSIPFLDYGQKDLISKDMSGQVDRLFNVSPEKLSAMAEKPEDMHDENDLPQNREVQKPPPPLDMGGWHIDESAIAPKKPVPVAPREEETMP